MAQFGDATQFLGQLAAAHAGQADVDQDDIRRRCTRATARAVAPLVAIRAA